MSQARVIAVVVGGVFLVVLAGLLVGSVRPTPIVEQVQGRKEASAPSPLPDLGLAALVGALAGAVGTHVLRERAEAKRATRELRGFLRMLYVEIETNRGEAELLLFAPNPRAGPWSDTAFKNDTWKEVRPRLAQVMPDADHFNQLVVYYVRNDSQERGIFRVIEMGSSFRNPDNAMASLMANLLRQQMDLAVEVLEAVMNSIRNGLGMRKTENRKGPS
jgi:hypothetical protein